jgi:KDO2-lipid IV(A) lauroyltransferase
MNKKQEHHNSIRALKFHQLLAPRHWLTWFAMGIFFCISHLPYRFQLTLGRRVGILVYHSRVMKKWRHIANTNLALCFPEQNAIEREKLLKASYQNLGMSVFETGMSWWKPRQKMPASFISIDFPISVVGRHQNNPVIDTLLKRSRNAGNITLIDRKNLRGIIKALKNNQLVWYAPDQDYGIKHSVFAPFFGTPAASITVPTWIAEQSSAVVLFVSYHRLPDAQGYKAGNLEQDASQINQLIENAVREHPEQYLWIHRRFKTRPEGCADVYATDLNARVTA